MISNHRVARQAVALGAAALCGLLLACAQPAGSTSPTAASGTPAAQGTGGGPNPQPQPAVSPGTSPSAVPAVVAPSPGLAPSQNADWMIRPGQGGGSHSNVASVRNDRDGRLEVQASVDLAEIRGDQVTPVNAARAESSCRQCQSIAVAIQVALYERGASYVAPQNQALAVNSHCDGCVTVARAIQYVIPVDDLRAVPDDVQELVKELDREAKYFERLRDVQQVDPNEANARLAAVTAKYNRLTQFLSDLADEDRSQGTPGPSPSASVTVTASPTRGTAGSPVPAGSATLAPAQAVTPAPGTPAATATSNVGATGTPRPATTPAVSASPTP